MRHRHREVHGGVVIMEAGSGYDADSYIVECVERHNAEVLVVTNDRELQRLCGEEGAEIMRVDEFWAIVQEVAADASLAERSSWKPGQAQDDIQLLADDTDPDLDSLMIEASLGSLPYKENNSGDELSVRTSSGRKLSKKEKKTQSLRKKIR